MPLHRRTAPTYFGGLPATHDFINDPVANADPGPAAPGDTGKETVTGTYFVALNQNATTFNVNRSALALAENTDFLDNIVHTSIPMPSFADFVAGGGGDTQQTITDDIFVGRSGLTVTQPERNLLIAVIDPTTLDEITDAAGTKVVASDIRDSGDTGNIVGGEAEGFHTNPIIRFTPTIPATADYRLIYFRRGTVRAESDPANVTGDMGFMTGLSLTNIGRQVASTLSSKALTSALSSGNNLSAGTLTSQLQDIIDNYLPFDGTNEWTGINTYTREQVFNSSDVAIQRLQGASKRIVNEVTASFVHQFLNVGPQWRTDDVFRFQTLTGLDQFTLDTVNDRIDIGPNIVALRWAGNNNTDVVIEKVKQTGPATATTAAMTSLAAQEGRDVASGNNNDGGVVDLRIGSVGTGGTAPTITDEKGQPGSLIVSYSQTTDQFTREWFFRGPTPTDNQSHTVTIDLSDHGLILSSTADSAIWVEVHAYVIDEPGSASGSGVYTVVAMIKDISAPSPFVRHGPQVQLAKMDTFADVSVTIQPAATTTGPQIDIVYNGGTGPGHWGAHIKVWVGVTEDL